MKTFTNIILVALAALFCAISAGCAGDRSLSTDLTELTLDASDTADHAISVDASASWVVDMAALVDWLSVRYSEQDSKIMWVSAKERNESLEPRSTQILIISANGLSISIPIRQKAMNIAISASPRVLEFEARDVRTREITVETELVSWEAIPRDGSWIKAARASDRNAVLVEVNPSRTMDLRRDSIVVRPLNAIYHSRADTVAIVQAGIDLLVMGDAVDESTGEMNFAAQGGTYSLRVFSRNPWEIKVEGAAGSVNFDTMTGKGDAENGELIKMTVAPNENAVDYKFVLMWMAGGDIFNYSCKQKAKI